MASKRQLQYTEVLGLHDTAKITLWNPRINGSDVDVKSMGSSTVYKTESYGLTWNLNDGVRVDKLPHTQLIVVKLGRYKGKLYNIEVIDDTGNVVDTSISGNITLLVKSMSKYYPRSVAELELGEYEVAMLDLEGNISDGRVSVRIYNNPSEVFSLKFRTPPGINIEYDSYVITRTVGCAENSYNKMLIISLHTPFPLHCAGAVSTLHESSPLFPKTSGSPLNIVTVRSHSPPPPSPSSPDMNCGMFVPTDTHPIPSPIIHSSHLDGYYTTFGHTVQPSKNIDWA